MQCVNPQCGKELQAGAKFCGYCGTAQPSLTETAAPAEARDGPVEPPATTPVQPATPQRSRSGTLVMRAGRAIWYFEEAEPTPKPGEARPVLILSEEWVDLADTAKVLTPAEVYERVRVRVEESSVPVDVSLVRARWLNDPREARERIVASLRDHAYQDTKMIMGLDYMGRWAKFAIHIGIEPDVVQGEPTSPWPRYLMIGGAVLAVIGFAAGQGGLGLIGLGVAGLGAYLATRGKKAKDLRHLMAQRAAVAKKLARTYKVDDARLFHTAMKQVFKAVVDDIVEQGGGVKRLEGGGGELFDRTQGTPAAASARVSDASELDV